MPCHEHGAVPHLGCAACRGAAKRPLAGPLGAGPLPPQPQRGAAPPAGDQGPSRRGERPGASKLTIFALEPDQTGSSAVAMVEFYDQPDVLYPAVALREQGLALALTPIKARELACTLIAYAAEAEEYNSAEKG